MKRYMIDSLKEDELIKKLQQEHEIVFTFLNILEYVKEKYEINIVDLAKVLNISRATIYNNFEKKTSNLSLKIKERIAEIYGLKDFSKVLEIEKKVEYATFTDKILLEEDIKADMNIMPSDEETYKETYMRIYQIKSDYDGRLKYVELKQNFRFDLFWEHAIQEVRAESIGILNFKPNHNELVLLNKLLKKMISKTSNEYIETLMRTLEKKVDQINLHLINYIDDYSKPNDR